MRLKHCLLPLPWLLALPMLQAAFNTIECENYDAMNGVAIEGPPGDQRVGSFAAGDWFRFDAVDFEDGARGMTVELATMQTTAEFEVRIDAVDGDLIATYSPQNTGDWGAVEAQSFAIAQTSGVHDLYFVGTNSGNIAKMDRFILNRHLANTTIDLPESLDGSTGPVSYQVVDALGLSFTQPVALVSPPADNRLFVVEQPGVIQLVEDLAAPSKQVFLDLTALVRNDNPEEGLLGLAFHPQYASNGYFYVSYTYGANGANRHHRYSRFSVQPGNPNQADPTSELILIEQRDEAANHNGGDLHFGSDGYLYISLGDEGGANDNLNNSQLIDKDFFSGILRIDVDRLPTNHDPNPHPAIHTDGGVARYKVPADNPWVGASSFNGSPLTGTLREEFWAVGLRNPWRMSFDPLTGDLWGGDVGQDDREEINLMVAGGNYGWAIKEGTLDGPDAPGPGGIVLDDPIYEYNHGTGARSAVGGVVYRGTNYPQIQGVYVYSDVYLGIFTLTPNGSGYDQATASNVTGIVSFGTDPRNGDILMCNAFTGLIQRLEVVATPAPQPPATLSLTGIFSDPATLTPAEGVHAYDINVPFWSDYAIKSRWFSVPDGNDTIGYQRDDNWTFPEGTVWIKHFDIELERGNPTTKQRIETRVLRKTATGVYGISYQWDAGGTQANLVPDAGTTINYTIDVGGVPTPQTWTIPSRADCLSCHNAAGGTALGFNTRQLNKESLFMGSMQEQLATLEASGYLDSVVEDKHVLPKLAAADDTTQSVQHRVRSYLAANCVYCHRAGGPAPTAWDARPELALADTDIINGAVNVTGGNANARVIVPGSLNDSVLLQRIARSDPATYGIMPPLGSSEVDQAAVTLLTDWILGEATAHQSFADWQTTHFGSPTAPGAAETDDPDGDGNSNLLEFLTMTDPNTAGSAWTYSFRKQAGQAIFEFERSPNRQYLVETSTDLLNWSAWNVPGNAPVIGGSPQNVTVQDTIDPLTPSRFYRLRIIEQ